MSITSKKEGANRSCDSENCEATFGSHYALQVALQTMKERCQQLQQRLLAVEGENVTLRIEAEKKNSCTNEKDANKASNTTDGDQDSKTVVENLQQQVTQLTRQKSQLSHHIFMVANENRQLWSRLSRLTEANQSLGNHLTRISDTLNQHPVKTTTALLKGTAAIKDTNGMECTLKDQLPTDCNLKGRRVSLTEEDSRSNRSSLGSEEAKEESLEELSIKLIKSFLQEKNDLEQQYAQMVQIQTDCPSFTIPDLGFTYDTEGDESIVDEVKQHSEKLQSMHEDLKKQHEELKETVCKLELMKNGNILCSHCKTVKNEKVPAEKTTQAEIVEMESLRTWGATGNLSYNEDLNRQLKQVAEPPGQEPCLSPSKRRSAVRRLEVRSSSFNAITTSMPTYQASETEQSQLKEWMCPLCSSIYSTGKTFEEFHQHVMSHFSSEDESDSIVENFEVISNDIGTH